MAQYCRRCPKRDTCRKVCDEVKEYLKGETSPQGEDLVSPSANQTAEQSLDNLAFANKHLPKFLKSDDEAKEKSRKQLQIRARDTHQLSPVEEKVIKAWLRKRAKRELKGIRTKQRELAAKLGISESQFSQAKKNAKIKMQKSTKDKECS